jgi:predicted ATPase/DNA-binding SARP family transcriptional activator
MVEATMTPQLQIRTLGGLTIDCNGTPITAFDQRKVPALLVYLAFAERPQPREVLAELFWEDRTQSQSSANLRVALSNLRKTVDPFVDVNRETAGMATGGWWLDAVAFEECLEKPGQNVEQLEKALELYQGDFLEGFYIDSRGFEDWALLERERLRFRAMEAFDRLIDCHLNQGHYAEGITHATRLLQLDPLREKTHRSLMRLLALSGEREAALAQYETCRQMLETEFGVKPTPETHTLYQTIRAGTFVPEPVVLSPPTEPEPVWQRTRHNLPVQSTSFVGREDDITAIIEQLMDSDCRLLTLLGSGGMGKTRLALAVAERLVDDFPHGVFFVPLAPVSAPDEIVPAIATAVQFQFYQGPDSAEQQLLNFLRDKDMLLVLDNCEHLLEGMGLVDNILSTAPGVTVLATSRESLSLGWEWLYEVRGMIHPATLDADTLEDYGAIRLFVERARRVQPDFRLADEREHVIRICQLVEGMPLGIEIAAAWLRMMPCDAIADELLDLETLQRDVPERHFSLRALFDHTWQRLTAQEQTTFTKLSVFRGGFTQEAAESVAQTTLPRLAMLVNKSLLHYDRASRRYSLHELLRQYADAKLGATPSQEHGVRNDHARYYGEFLEQRYEQIRSNDQNETLAEIDNLQTAWNWAVTTCNLAVFRMSLRSLFWLYALQAKDHQGIRKALGQAVTALRRVAPTDERNLVLGHILAVQAVFSPDDGRPLAEEGLALVRKFGTRADIAFVQLIAGVSLGHSDERLTYYQDSLAIYSELGDQWGTARCLYDIGMVNYWHLLNITEGKQYIEQAYTIFREIGDQDGIRLCLQNLGIIEGLQGNHAAARRYTEASLAIVRKLGNRPRTADLLSNLAYNVVALGRFDEAEQYATRAVNIAKEIGNRFQTVDFLDTLGDIKYGQEEYIAAKQLFEECMTISTKLADARRTVFAHKQFAFVEIALGDYPAARQHLHQALSAAHDHRNLPFIIDCLVAMALLFAAEGQAERALELLGFTVSRPAVGKHARNEARLRAELEAEFGPDAVEAAIARGQGQDPAAVARAVLADLEDEPYPASNSAIL